VRIVQLCLNVLSQASPTGACMSGVHGPRASLKPLYSSRMQQMLLPLVVTVPRPYIASPDRVEGYAYPDGLLRARPLRADQSTSYALKPVISCVCNTYRSSHVRHSAPGTVSQRHVAINGMSRRCERMLVWLVTALTHASSARRHTLDLSSPCNLQRGTLPHVAMVSDTTITPRLSSLYQVPTKVAWMRRSWAGLAGHNASLSIHSTADRAAGMSSYRNKRCVEARRQGGLEVAELVSSYRGTHTHQEAENGHRRTRQALQRRVCLSGPSSQR